jgi:hypothetical protein
MMTRKRKLSDEEDEHVPSDSDTEISSDDESNEEDPSISLLVQQLSKAISHKNSMDLLHSMTTSKDILFWNSYGENSRNEHGGFGRVRTSTLPLRNKKTASLNTFIDGLAEIGINKKLIKNKQLLADLVARQQEKDNLVNTQSDTDNSGGTDSDENSDNSDVEENSEGSFEEEDSQEEEETSAEDQEEESETEDENETPCTSCGGCNVHMTCIMRCPKCHWYEDYSKTLKNGIIQCDICQKIFSVNRTTLKEVLHQCQECGALRHVSAKSNK